MTFDDYITFTSDTNGKRLLIRKDDIGVVFEVAPAFDQYKNLQPAHSTITLRTHSSVYAVKQTYNEVMELMGRQQ